MKSPDLFGEVRTISGNFHGKEISIPASRLRIKTDLHFIGDNPVSLPAGWTDFLEEGQHVVAEGYPVPVKSIHKQGRWTLDELEETMPATLALGLVNPAPPESA